ncbi:MAG: DNA polymerase III subunit gamma/tau [Oceanospirillaceae bacterium]|nr:DNA polymerase III subunit gamma/tau [Oceanospirillaceae bacterium]
MSYQVLARKWRPKQFTEMVGQGHVLKALVNALDDNRLHHAYLFTGTRGVGKTSIARLFAKALNCEQGISSKPCGQCSACTEIAEGRFVDLIEVDAASRTKVEDTRELLENVQYAPSRGRFKVYLIDEVHMLSKSSFNALLKTLEEPPPHVKFLLATTDPQKLPVTVLSRCLQFNLKNMIPQRIVEHLSTVLSAEQIPFEEGALWLLARSADGSMRDALSLTDQSIAFGAGTVNEADVRVMLGSIDLQLVNEILTALVDGDGVSLLACVDDLAQFSPDYNTVLGDIVSLLHRIAIAQTVPAALDNSMGDKQQVAELASKLSAEDVQLFYQIALMGRKDLPFVPDAREGLEMTLLRMLAFRPAGSTHVKPAPLMVSPANAEQNNEKVEPNEAAVPLSSVSTAPVATTTQSLSNTALDASDLPEQAEAIAEVEPQPIAELAPSVQNQSLNTTNIEPATDSDEVAESVVEVVALVPQTPVPEEQVAVLEQDSSLASPHNAVPEQPTVAMTAQAAEAVSPVKVQPVVVTSEVSMPVSAQITAAAAPSVSAPAMSPVVSDVDTPPWEDDYQSYQQQHTESQMPAKAVVKTPVLESVTAQINVSNMLDAAVTDFAQLELDNWPALVGSIGFTGMTAHIAENLSLETIIDNVLQFNVSQVQKNVLDQTQKERIQNMLSQYFNTAVQVRYDSEKSTRETPWQCFEKLRAQKLKQAIASFQGDEMVQQLVAVFSGEIERSSIMPLN